MPRPYTPAQLAAVLAAARSDHLRVEIEDATGVYREVGGAGAATAYYGADFVDVVEWGGGIDDATEGGTLTLKRDAFDADGDLVSLMPLMTASPANQTGAGYGPAIDVGRGIRISLAVLGAAATPGAGDWIPMLDGRIDDYDGGGGGVNDPGGDTITLPFRDRGAALLDLPIDEERVYGAEAGEPIEDTAQRILDDNLAGATLYVAASAPAFDVLPYRQSADVGVLEALRALALQAAGADVRYTWSAGVLGTSTDSVSRLTLWTPPRAKTDPDLTIGPDHYTRLPRVAASLEGVRSPWTVEYTNQATGQREKYTTPFTGSPYGYRPATVREDAASNVDTHAEAAAMANAADHDTRAPELEQAVEIDGLLWMVQLGDLIGLLPNAVHYDEAQRCGVLRYRFRFAEGKGTTTIEGRAAIAGAFQRWLDLARQPGSPFQRAAGPAPIIGPFLGEASGDGGTSGMGACWCFVRFEPRTAGVRFHTNAGPETPLAAPLLDDAHGSYDIRRPEGAIGRADDFQTLLVFDTPEGWYRLLHGLGYGYDRRVGLPATPEARAVDGLAATMGAITALDVVREGNRSVLTYAATLSTSPHPVWHIVWRNGIAIALVPEAAAGTFEDPDLPADRTFTYELQPFTHDGVAFARSGQRFDTRRPPIEEEPPPAPGAAVPPKFVNNTPVTYRVGLIPTRTVVQGQCTDPDAAFLAAQYWDGLTWQESEMVENPVPGATVTMEFPAEAARVFRIVSRGADGVDREVSATRSVRFAADPSPGGPL